MMSVASEDTGGVVQKFADSGEEDTYVPQEKEVPKRKAVRKNVIRKVKKQERSVTIVAVMEKGLGDVLMRQL
jgi:folate-dependent phosphoribosylglycinamide formyltransferase PurN